MSTRLNKYFLYQSIFTLLLTTNVFYGQNNSFIRGVDGSVLDEVEQNGGMYYDDGVQKDALEIFKKYGVNLVRMKLWHSPETQFNSLPRVMVMAQRVKALGLKFMLDIHYSDTWADVDTQTKPTAWEGLSFEVLKDSVYQYTKNVITALKAQNTLPDYVQIGNEISCGMLWDDGNICGVNATQQQWNKLGMLIKNAIDGMNDALSQGEEIKTIIHFDDGGNNVGCQWFFDNMMNQGINFDIIGLSYYPWWHGTINDLKSNLNDLATRYGKDLMVVEDAYPWTLSWGDNTFNPVGSEDQLLDGYPATVEGQKKFISDVIVAIQNTADNKGAGYVYWSPEWIPGHPGSPWENLALFNFQGNALESMSALNTYVRIDENTDKNSLSQFTVNPNPFKESANIAFYLSKTQAVTISISDTFGNKVSTLMFNKKTKKGSHSIRLNAALFAPGVYYIIANGKNFSQTIKALKIE